MKHLKLTSHVVGCSLARLVRHFGFVLLPISEIERMESDAAGSYEVMKRNGISERNAGYFNGLADRGSKTATQFRQRYMSNDQDQVRGWKPRPATQKGK